MLSGVLVDFGGHNVMVSFFVGCVQKLNFLQNLKSGDGNVLEFIDANHVFWSFVVETDVS